MKILVTGGAGYIGSHTCVNLLEEGHQVAVLDNFCNSYIEVIERIELISDRKIEIFKADVRDQVAVERVFDCFAPDAVFHFAGLKATGESVQYPLSYYDYNLLGSILLLKIMSKKNVKRLIFSSSATVYGNVIEVPISENAVIAPINPYGQTKAMIEKLFTDLVSSDSSWSIVCLRYFNPVGAHKSGLIGESPNGIPNNLAPYIMQVALGKLNELKVYGGDYATPDGTGVRDYIHVMDLADGHLAALNYVTTHFGMLAVNLGTGQGSSVLEILASFQNCSEKSIPYKIVERRLGDVAKSFTDPSKAERLLGWTSQLSLDTMCKDAWRWQLKNPNGYDVPGSG